MCRVVLKAYRDLPRVDVSVRLLKAASWDAETVYISLPFTSGEGSVFWLDKAGALVRPRVDQLPNSLADFYAVMEGVAWTDGKRGVAVASPDAPLVQVGPLEHGVRKLHGHPKMSEEKESIYSWPINPTSATGRTKKAFSSVKPPKMGQTSPLRGGGYL